MRLNATQLARALGLSAGQVARLKAKGVIRGRMFGRRMLFALEDARAAVAASEARAHAALGRTRRRAPLLSCCKCQQVLPRDQFVPTIERQRRGSNTYEYKTVSSDCRGCRKEQKREARRRKAEQAGKTFVPVGERAGYEARCRAEREARKQQRAIAWALCRAFRTLMRMTHTQATKRIVDRQRERYNTDPEYQARMKAKKLRRKHAIESTQLEPVQRELVAERDGWRCAICGGKVTKANWSLDHVVPLSKGGPHTYANVVLAHRSCNSKRGAGRFPVQAPLFSRT